MNQTKGEHMNATAHEVIDAIQRGRVDDDIRQILQTINDRIKIVARIKMASLVPGDRVRFTDATRPVYLRGAEAVVEKVNQSSVTVRMAEDRRKYAVGSKVRVPNTLLEPTQ